MELRSYFGLTPAQIEEFKTKWNELYESQKALFLQLAVPHRAGVEPDALAVGFWQWARSWVTQEVDPAGVESVTKLTNSVAGFPEINYWRKRYLCEGDTISAENKDALCGPDL